MRKAAFMAILALIAVAACAQDNTSSVKFTVLKAESGKPVRNASVVLHAVDKEGHQGKGGFELKTDPEGITSFDGAPYGKLRVQVLAHGFQTYGEDFEINKPQQQIVIKLHRPQPQYSIYGNNKPKDDKQKDDKAKDEGKPKQ